MTRKDGESAISALCANVLGARFEDLETRIVENAKHRIVDILGCVIGGAHAAGNKGLVDLARKWGGAGEATIMVHGGKVPAGNAAMVNSIMCRSYDFEVMSIVMEGQFIASHHSGTTVMTALTMGEKCRTSGKELITALVAGDDVASRVLAAGGFDFDLGWDGTMTLPIFGSVPIAGRLMGLSEYEMRHAFGIALNMVAGSIQSLWDGAATFKLGQGTAARNGIFAAELAAEGWTGVEDPLLSRFGYFNLYGKGCRRPEVLTKFLGERYYVEETFKSHPCGWPNQGPIQCAMAIAAKGPLKADEVEEVLVRLPGWHLGLYYAKPYVPGDFPHSSAIFSFQFNVATALLKGDVQPEHFSEAAIRDPQLNLLISKTRCVELLPQGGGRSVEVVVKMKDGREFSERTETWKGDPLADPMPKSDIIAKFHRQLDFSGTVGRENGERILTLVDKLEELDDMSVITDLVRP